MAQSTVRDAELRKRTTRKAAVCRRSRIQRAWSVVLMMLATVTAAAQDKPDFSGRWVLAAPPQSGPDIPSALSVRQSLVRTTTHGDAMEPFFKDIAIDRQFESGTRSEAHPIGVVGGVVPSLRANGTPNGPKGHHGVQWEGNSLVFVNGSYTGQIRETGVWAERSEVWSLDPDGRLRVVITTRNSADGSRAVTLVYRRP
jgi:hypothetical protein